MSDLTDYERMVVRPQIASLTARLDAALDLLEQIYDIGLGESSVQLENLLIESGRVER